MLTCPHSLDHIPRSQDNHPCPLGMKDIKYLLFMHLFCDRKKLAHNWDPIETKLNFADSLFEKRHPSHYSWLQTSPAHGSVRVYTELTSAGVDQRVQSIHAGPWVIKAWNGADKWNHTQTVQGSVKNGRHKFTLGKNGEEKSLFTSEHWRLIFNIHPHVTPLAALFIYGFTAEWRRTAYHSRAEQLLEVPKTWQKPCHRSLNGSQ